jgi:hypothetical protein
MGHFANGELLGEEMSDWAYAVARGLVDARLSALGVLIVLICVSSQTLREVLASVLVVAECGVSTAALNGIQSGPMGCSPCFAAWDRFTSEAVGPRPGLLCLGSLDLLFIFFMEVDHEGLTVWLPQGW